MPLPVKKRKAMAKTLGLTNPMAHPRLEKIVINVGVGDATQDKKRIGVVVDHLRRITGQKPVVTKARRSVANFKLREGNAIGCMVTMRGGRMESFLERLVNIVIPRIRDFRGLRPRLDGHGNFTVGIKEQGVFPEIPFEAIGTTRRGFSITIVTTAKDDAEGLALLRAWGVPFIEEEK
ncbi:50S ribosomal protein L5 [bacterium]|nr:50S ribosomal protein L5 [bacterium]